MCSCTNSMSSASLSPRIMSSQSCLAFPQAISRVVSNPPPPSSIGQFVTALPAGEAGLTGPERPRYRSWPPTPSTCRRVVVSPRGRRRAACGPPPRRRAPLAVLAVRSGPPVGYLRPDVPGVLGDDTPGLPPPGGVLGGGPPATNSRGRNTLPSRLSGPPARLTAGTPLRVAVREPDAGAAGDPGPARHLLRKGCDSHFWIRSERR